VGKNLQSDIAFVTLKGRRENPEGALRRDFQHHPLSITGFDGPGSLGNRPPAGTLAIAQADGAGTRPGWRIFACQINAGHCRNEFGTVGGLNQ